MHRSLYVQRPRLHPVSYTSHLASWYSAPCIKHHTAVNMPRRFYILPSAWSVSPEVHPAPCSMHHAFCIYTACAAYHTFYLFEHVPYHMHHDNAPCITYHALQGVRHATFPCIIHRTPRRMSNAPCRSTSRSMRGRLSIFILLHAPCSIHQHHKHHTPLAMHNPSCIMHPTSK